MASRSPTASPARFPSGCAKPGARWWGSISRRRRVGLPSASVAPCSMHRPMGSMEPATGDAAQVRALAHDLLRKLEVIEQLATSPEEERIYGQLASAFDECLAQLGKLNLWGPANRLPSSELWNVAGHLLTRGWLQNRARTKPRGYVGDHEMLARIYERRLCDEPLGRLFDRYFQEQAAPQAVRNRMTMMAEWIVQSAATTDRLT